MNVFVTSSCLLSRRVTFDRGQRVEMCNCVVGIINGCLLEARKATVMKLQLVTPAVATVALLNCFLC